MFGFNMLGFNMETDANLTEEEHPSVAKTNADITNINNRYLYINNMYL